MAIRKELRDTKVFHFYNENPKDHRTGDCVIRAIGLATELGWDEVYKSLCKYGYKKKLMPNDKQCYDKWLQENGWVKHKQPRKSDNTKYTGIEFCNLLQDWIHDDDLIGCEYKGVVISRSIIAHIGGHHLVAIVDGKINDIWYSQDGCIGNYWTKE